MASNRKRQSSTSDVSPSTTRKKGRSTSPPLPPAAPENTAHRGAAVRIWKKDPSVESIGIRKVFLPSDVQEGPSDKRISISSGLVKIMKTSQNKYSITEESIGGLVKIGHNENGDFLVEERDAAAFDAVHTFAVARMTLTMYERALQKPGQPAELHFSWNVGDNKDPIEIHPRGAKEFKNALYVPEKHAIYCGYFTPIGGDDRTPYTYTCRSLDMVSHEMGHAILHGLKPGWSKPNCPPQTGAAPQTGALHESFGDLTAMFLMLTQLDLVEHLIAESKADLYAPNFCSELANQFARDSERRDCLRNAANDLKMSNVDPCNDHEVSQVFTGAIYCILAEMFKRNREPLLVDDAVTLHKTAAEVRGLLLQAIKDAPAVDASFSDVAWAMHSAAAPDQQKIIENEFKERGIFLEQGEVEDVDSGSVRAMGFAKNSEAQEMKRRDQKAVQNREGCCATMRMQVEEYLKTTEQTTSTLTNGSAASK